jgi:hypothetical protein
MLNYEDCGIISSNYQMAAFNVLWLISFIIPLPIHLLIHFNAGYLFK